MSLPPSHPRAAAGRPIDMEATSSTPRSKMGQGSHSHRCQAASSTTTATTTNPSNHNTTKPKQHIPPRPVYRYARHSHRMGSIDSVLYRIDEHDGRYEHQQGGAHQGSRSIRTCDYSARSRESDNDTLVATTTPALVPCIDFEPTRPLDMKLRFEDRYYTPAASRNTLVPGREGEMEMEGRDGGRGEAMMKTSLPSPPSEDGSSVYSKRSNPTYTDRRTPSARQQINAGASLSCLPSVPQGKGDPNSTTRGAHANPPVASQAGHNVLRRRDVAAAMEQAEAPLRLEPWAPEAKGRPRMYRMCVSGYYAESIVTELAADEGSDSDMYDPKSDGLYFRHGSLGGKNVVFELNPWLRLQGHATMWKPCLDRSDGVVVVYSTADRHSFAQARSSCARLFEHTTCTTRKKSQVVPAMVLAVDMRRSPAAHGIPASEGEAMAHAFGMPYGEVSVRDVDQIEQVFCTMARMIDGCGGGGRSSLSWNINGWRREAPPAPAAASAPPSRSKSKSAKSAPGCLALPNRSASTTNANAHRAQGLGLGTAAAGRASVRSKATSAPSLPLRSPLRPPSLDFYNSEQHQPLLLRQDSRGQYANANTGSSSYYHHEQPQQMQRRPYLPLDGANDSTSFMSSGGVLRYASTARVEKAQHVMVRPAAADQGLQQSFLQQRGGSWDGGDDDDVDDDFRGLKYENLLSSNGPNEGVYYGGSSRGGGGGGGGGEVWFDDGCFPFRPGKPKWAAAREREGRDGRGGRELRELRPSTAQGGGDADGDAEVRSWLSRTEGGMR